MDIKTIILVIILSALIGVGIFAAGNILDKNSQAPVQSQTQSAPKVSLPSPKASESPINENTNLKEEIDKLNPPDFSQDYSKLKQEISQ